MLISIYIALICFGMYQCHSETFENNGDFRVGIRHVQTNLKYPNEIHVSSLFNSAFFGGYKTVIAQAKEVLTSGSLHNDFNVSLCFTNTIILLEALSKNETWAIQMIDAIGKPASGLLDGHLTWPGDWDECINVQAVAFENTTKKTQPTNAYKGKYCIASFALNQSGVPEDVALNIGVCVPDTCNNEEAQLVVQMLVRLIPFKISIFMNPSVSCQENELEYTKTATAVTAVCAVILCIILVATTYDIITTCIVLKRSDYEKLTPYQESTYSSFTAKENNDISNIISGSYNQSQNTQDGAILHHGSNVQKVSTAPVNQPNLDIKANYKAGLLGRLLLSFSIYTNAPKIFNTNQPTGSITSINGIRFISMTWVILGHTYVFGIKEVENAVLWLPELIKRFTFQAIINATFAVDTFFVLSGFLVAYLSLKEMKTLQSLWDFKWGMFYFHRLWRLTPPYMLFMMLYVPTIKYYADGPFWPQQGVELNECKDTWWKNLLYINNLYKANETVTLSDPDKLCYGMPQSCVLGLIFFILNTQPLTNVILSHTVSHMLYTDDMQCMAWTWYLANDMQFYVISPLMLIPLYYSSVIGTLSCMAFVLVSFISTGVISSIHHISANFALGDTKDEFDLIYFKPWCRVGPYVVGIFTGYILYKTDGKVKISKWMNMLGWAIATSLALMVLYGLWTDDGSSKLDVNMSALYNATSRTVWGMCVCWVIFACATGYGGPVNKLLSWNTLIPLSRLTYCAYLVHPVVMYVYYGSRKTLMYWDDLEISYLFIGNLCLSYGVALIISLAFESPMMGLEKVLLGRDKRS